MAYLKADNKQLQVFVDDVQTIIGNLTGKAKQADLDSLETLASNFKRKTEDFYRENRKLNIGVVGQVKAGKSSFLNTLLFGGKEILPKASTPKTATLTKMEYSEQNIIEIEYYAVEEWEVLEENAAVDLPEEIYTSAKEIVDMVGKSGIDPHEYLQKGKEQITFDTYEDLIAHLNDYVGEDGKYTPLVKAVTLYLHKEEFAGLSIVDTPGLNDPIVSRTIRTKEFMEVCDVVFFLSQSGNFLDKSDWELLSSQLPQKGVKRLVLIASKYDSGLRDVLKKEDASPFRRDTGKADNIPDACGLVAKKLKKRAKERVEEYIKKLSELPGSSDLIRMIGQCKEPILASALAENMAGKSPEEYNAEEQNIYFALQQFSNDLEQDLKRIGNFDEIREIYDEVIAEKEKILQEKSVSFVPTAKLELKSQLEGFKEKAEKRMTALEKNDKGQLAEQKRIMETQIGNVKADIAAVFDEVNARLEEKRAAGVRELREASKDYLSIPAQEGVRTQTGTYTTGFWFWKKVHTYTYPEHYSYWMSADAIDNIHKFSVEARNHVEKVFTESIRVKEIKRKLLDVVVKNFDLGSEKYDSSLFRIMVEETISAIEFPIFEFDVSGIVSKLAADFSGKLTSSKEAMALSQALYDALAQINQGLCDKMVSSVQQFKADMNQLADKVEESLLDNVMKEFEELIAQCENKEREIAEYKSYILALESELVKL